MKLIRISADDNVAIAVSDTEKGTAFDNYPFKALSFNE